jgi:superfamily II DNA/RNA helicase
LKGRIVSSILPPHAQEGWNQMTEIQKRRIPPALGGSDILGATNIGGGKTLSFSIPEVFYLHYFI